MQFRVPQFINIEDKIIGPLGWKQLAYVVAGLGSVYIIFKAFESKALASILSIPVICLFGALAFIRINNRDFLSISEDAVKYFFSDKIYTWQKDKNQKNIQPYQNSSTNNSTNTIINKSLGSKLSNKAFDVDIKANK